MKKFEMKKRANGKGSIIFLGKNRYKAWAARIVIGKDEFGRPIYHDIEKFENEVDALVFLENYYKNPTPIYIKKEKFNKIVTFPQNPYPLVAVDNPHDKVVAKIKKDNYTFKQLFEEFRLMKIPTEEEFKLEKDFHQKVQGKFHRHFARGLITAYHNSEPLYDRIYKELRTSDFQQFLNNCGKNPATLRQMANLYKNMDKYAIQEDIIEKSYSKDIIISDATQNTINKRKKTVFTYEQITYLWNIKTENLKEDFVRDFLLIALYTGARADELLSIYTKNIFLDKNFFVGGLKTKAGINREIPIHPDIKPIIEKYYNPEHEFLFHMPDSKIAKGRKANYDYYLYHYKFNFIEKHPFLAHHTAHECRHTLRTELEKKNIKQVIINSIIGHSNENVGQDFYTHISIEEKLEAIKQIDYKENKKLYIFVSNQ